MADKVEVANWPNTDSGSPERVAYDLMARITRIEMANSRAALLDLYAECLKATKGLR